MLESWDVKTAMFFDRRFCKKDQPIVYLVPGG